MAFRPLVKWLSITVGGAVVAALLYWGWRPAVPPKELKDAGPPPDALCEEVNADLRARRFNEERSSQLAARGGGNSAAIYRALTSGEVEFGDLERTPDGLSCGAYLWPSLVDRLAQDERIWALAVNVSEPMQRALAHKLSSGAANALLRHTNAAARLRQQGDTKIVATAETLCALVDVLAAGKVSACSVPSAQVDASAPVDPAAGVPPQFAKLAEQSRLERAALTECILECSRNRTPAQREEDRRMAQAANEALQACSAKCGGNSDCLKQCRATAPPPPSLACEPECGKRHPMGLQPPPRL